MPGQFRLGGDQLVAAGLGNRSRAARGAAVEKCAKTLDTAGKIAFRKVQIMILK
jgi:hypothetical protein